MKKAKAIFSLVVALMVLAISALHRIPVQQLRQQRPPSTATTMTGCTVKATKFTTCMETKSGSQAPTGLVSTAVKLFPRCLV